MTKERERIVKILLCHISALTFHFTVALILHHCFAPPMGDKTGAGLTPTTARRSGKSRFTKKKTERGAGQRHAASSGFATAGGDEAAGVSAVC